MPETLTASGPFSPIKFELFEGGIIVCLCLDYFTLPAGTVVGSFNGFNCFGV